MKKIGSGTYRLANPVDITVQEAIVGKMEKEGPLGKYFTNYSEDEYFGEETFEKAESRMQKEVLNRVLEQSKASPKPIDFVFAGDLLNQCISSNYSIRDLNVQFFGLYGACSTMAEAITLACMAIDGGFAERSIAMTSSHFCSAERQFRFPLEYGSQRPPAAQWTVTGSGCLLLETGKVGSGCPKVTEICPGAICDMGISDQNNMGAAMAAAAELTIKRFLDDTKSSPEDYDLIVTGDLGHIGHSILVELLAKDNIQAGSNFNDCGKMIFDKNSQDTHSGGSGCGCSATVLAGYILPEMKKGALKNVLFIATGALMSPVSTLQNESIPGIAHLIHITA